MKRYPCILTVFLCGMIAQAATATEKQPLSTKTASVAALHFLGGHWVGRVDNAKIEQTCSIADPTLMVCMFQLSGEKGTDMLEFYTIRDTPTGVEERVRFFSADLKADPGDGLTMKLTSSSPTTFVFENPNGTSPKRSTLTRIGDNAFHSHIELVDAGGHASTIDADWQRAN